MPNTKVLTDKVNKLITPILTEHSSSLKSIDYFLDGNMYYIRLNIATQEKIYTYNEINREINKAINKTHIFDGEYMLVLIYNDNIIYNFLKNPTEEVIERQRYNNIQHILDGSMQPVNPNRRETLKDFVTNYVNDYGQFFTVNNKLDDDLMATFDRTNTLIIGGSGKGKTYSVCQNILREKEASLIIDDWEYEKYDLCKSDLEEKGYKIKVFDLNKYEGDVIDKVRNFVSDRLEKDFTNFTEEQTAVFIESYYNDEKSSLIESIYKNIYETLKERRENIDNIQTTLPIRFIFDGFTKFNEIEDFNDLINMGSKFNTSAVITLQDLCTLRESYRGHINGKEIVKDEYVNILNNFSTNIWCNSMGETILTSEYFANLIDMDVEEFDYKTLNKCVVVANCIK